MSDIKFKVIVVGGGPVGLTAAHVLAKAGIDFVVLESYHTVTPDRGSAVGLWPPTHRVFDQLRILKPMDVDQHPMYRSRVLTHDGAIYAHGEQHRVILEKCACSHPRGTW